MSDSCTRRGFLQSLAGGSLLLPGLLQPLLADDARQDPLAPKPSHFRGRAKQVIFLFSTGGVSHLDTFDYKPKLFEMDSRSMVPGGGLSRDQKKLLRPQWAFKPGGRCGTMVSDVFPHLRETMDEIALINSLKSDDNEHFQATLAMHTGSFFAARPSVGSWVSYGLGTLNRNLPSFVVIAPTRADPRPDEALPRRRPPGGGTRPGGRLRPAVPEGQRQRLRARREDPVV